MPRYRFNIPHIKPYGVSLNKETPGIESFYVKDSRWDGDSYGGVVKAEDESHAKKIICERICHGRQRLPNGTSIYRIED